jgi:CDP-glucose 4,6-dehydratase
VLEAMRTTRSAKTLVFASSGAHYGATTTDKPIAEDDAPCPAVNLYGPSKTAADVVVRSYANVYGLGAAVCRFMNTYGPGDTNFTRIVPRAVVNLLNGTPYDFGDRDDGTTRLDFLHIRDMTGAYLSVAEHIEVARGEAFNFGRGQPVSTGDVARAASLAFDDVAREPIFRGKKRDVPVIKYLDIRKAQTMLGWQPQTSLEQGLRETIDWYRSHLARL